MTIEITFTLAIIIGALILFATEKLRVDVVALLVLIAVGLLELIPREEVFSGFSNSAVVTVWAVYMVSGALLKTGVADKMGSAILKVAGYKEYSLIVIIMFTIGIISAFMNNVGATAMLMPAVIGISRQTKVPVSKLLMPLAFASLLGGKMTLIGTPANILATGILDDRGLESFGFFEFTPMGVVLLVTGIVYMVLIGRHLLPIREGALAEDDIYQLPDYVAEVRVTDESPLIGKSLLESRLGREYDLSVLAIYRQNGDQPAVHRNTKLKAGDLLIVESSANDLIDASRTLGLAIVVDYELELDEIEPGDVQVIEATLAPNSHIAGLSMREVHFRDKYGFTALAISSKGEVITERLRDVPLNLGDSLLLQGPQHRIEGLLEDNDFVVLEPDEPEVFRTEKAPIAVGGLLLAIALVLFAGMEISLAMVIGAMIMILMRAISIEEAYEAVDWRTVFLVAGMLPLGLAMEHTGTARYLADVILGVFGPYGDVATLAGIYLLAALVTQPMSNAAAIVLIVPIALGHGSGIGCES